MVDTLHAAIAGRSRFRVNGLYRCDSLKEHIERRLAEDRTVISASANTLTSAILVHHDIAAPQGLIGSLIEEAVSEFGRSNGTDLSESRGWRMGAARRQRDVDGRVPGEVSRATAAPCPPSEKTLVERVKSSFSGKPNAQPERAWHAIDAEAALAVWGSSAEAGLSSEAACEKFAVFGPNHLPEAPHRSKFEIFLNQLNSLPVALLGVAAGVAVLTGGVVDAVVIMAVVAINSSIGFVTENEAERTISSLKTLTHPSAVVVRDGVRRRIDALNVVPGDTVILEPGTYIGADCRLLEAARLSVDESSLTGESVPVLKKTEMVKDPNTPISDRKNMVYMGTLVTGGQGLAVVVATGRFTEIGKLQAMIGETVSPQTPMEKQLNTVGNQLVWVSGAICGLVFMMGLMRRTPLGLILKTTISLAVAAVPEGLPTVATTTLALGIRKLNAHRVIIRDLEAVETLGEVQTICFDKTGTVTENRMAVTGIFTGNRKVELETGGILPGRAKNQPPQQPGVGATGENLYPVRGTQRTRG